ncbi:methylmalonyl-CoA mutase family protein [Actinocorallia sp. A-T 12471]|uniref:methylmalonyl-CoA mutase family protein n=1 Tax=Actinocorallia sp. A-T 12471 TaxID=3089813 RepID=UPI0029D3E9ED|nr:methylmalonyl-CoA mutase family protein [Actinocorallia sp. A-T 12471]MDX6744502.1 methylmalonyl-CoA mutase family protein [Actinocorallia sp. A-T 12471]
MELASAFPQAERERWRELLKGVLRKSGAATEDTPLDAVEDLLTRRSYDGVPISPLYTADEAVPSRPFPTAPRDGEGTSFGWDVRQRHDDPNPAATRAAIHDDLENGATSVWLTVGAAGLPVTALAEVLKDVYTELAPVVIDAGPQTRQAAEAFLKIAKPDTRGNLGADPLGLAARTGFLVPVPVDLAQKVVAEFPGIRTFAVDGTVYHDAGGSDAQELGAVLAAAVAYLRELTDAGLTVDQAAGQLEFRYAAHAGQFATIAKLRAARRLWTRVASLSGVADTTATIHAVTSSAMMTRRDPWVNMLRTTVACFAAGVGGADAVTVQPFDARLGLPDAFSRRIARNDQTLLLEESSLARVVDPAGGSWYVEALTEALAQAAWEFFTEIEKEGGLAAALDSGFLENALAETWEARRKDVARRKAPLTGLSEFPNLGETLPERPPAPEPLGGGLPRHTYGQDFEALRDISDAQAVRPKVFLATLGPVAVHTARATFAANLFQAGGIETVSGSADEFDGGVAVICSSDKLYAEQAEETARALRERGAVKVWLAGKGDYAGVDGNVYAGCNAIDVLEDTLRDLGVTV